MGDIVIGICSCGFKSDDIYIGCGMLVYHSETVCYCNSCEKILTEPTYNIPKICPTCDKDIIPYVSVSDDNDIEFKGGDGTNNEGKNYYCPKCKKESLKFHWGGIWD